ncbi:MarR family transcriptional regulator [Novosphingobium colocasiae]
MRPASRSRPRARPRTTPRPSNLPTGHSHGSMRYCRRAIRWPAFRAGCANCARTRSVFLEGGSEEVLIGGRVFHRFAGRGSAWAASLAAAMRPHLFGLGAAPLALAGLAPRSLFAAEPESPLPALLADTIATAAYDLVTDLTDIHQAVTLGDTRLAALYASSQAPAAWRLIAALGPLTRAELARALVITRRTASQAATALEKAGLATLRHGDKALLPMGPARTD